MTDTVSAQDNAGPITCHVEFAGLTFEGTRAHIRIIDLLDDDLAEVPRLLNTWTAEGHADIYGIRVALLTYSDSSRRVALETVMRDLWEAIGHGTGTRIAQIAEARVSEHLAYWFCMSAVAYSGLVKYEQLAEREDVSTDAEALGGNRILANVHRAQLRYFARIQGLDAAVHTELDAIASRSDVLRSKMSMQDVATLAYALVSSGRVKGVSYTGLAERLRSAFNMDANKKTPRNAWDKARRLQSFQDREYDILEKLRAALDAVPPLDPQKG